MKIRLSTSIYRFYYFLILFLSLSFALYLLFEDLHGGFANYWVDDFYVRVSFMVISGFFSLFLLLPTFFAHLIFFSPRRYANELDKRPLRWAFGIFLLVIFPNLIVAIFVASLLFTHAFSNEVLASFFLKSLDLEKDLSIIRANADLSVFYNYLLELPRYQFVERFDLAISSVPQYVVFLFYLFIAAVFLLPSLSSLFVMSVQNVGQRRRMMSSCAEAGVNIDEFSVFTPEGKEVFVTRFEKVEALFQALGSSSVQLPKVDKSIHKHPVDVTLQYDVHEAPQRFRIRLKRIFR